MRLMSWRPVRKLEGIAEVFLGTQLLDIAEYDLELYEEDPEHHEQHVEHWAPGTKIEGTVSGKLPIRKTLRLVTEEGYSLSFHVRDSFGTVAIEGPLLDTAGKPVR